MMDKFNEFYMMQNQAKKFEQSGLDDKALELYLKIITEYLPNNDFSYDRAATLLEKKFKYAEAIGICEKAIEKINAADIQGDAEKFRLKIDRIRLKSKGDTDGQSTAAKKAPEEFHFGLPGFRTTNRLTMTFAALYYAMAAYSSYPDELYTFLVLFSLAFAGSYGFELMLKLHTRKACAKAFAITLLALAVAVYSLAQIPQLKIYWAVDGTQVSDSEEDGGVVGEGASETPDTDRIPPEIPPDYLDKTAKAADKDPATENAVVTADKGQVIIDLVVIPGTSQERVEKIAIDMTKTLGGLMTSENLKGPSDTSLGEVYDFYSVIFIVTDTLEQPVNEGILTLKSAEIKWTEPIEKPTSSQ